MVFEYHSELSNAPNILNPYPVTQAPPPGAAIKHRRRKDARPGELLAAALALFVERGYVATRLQDVAVQAGVAKGTIYRYFKNKDELLAAVVHEYIRPTMEEIDDATMMNPSSRDRLRTVIAAWWKRIGETRAYGLVALLMVEGRQFPHLAHYCHEQTIARYRTTIADILASAVAKGEFHPVDIAGTTQLLLTPILAQLVRQYAHGGACAYQFVEPGFPGAFLDFMFDALSTNAGAH